MGMGVEEGNYSPAWRQHSERMSACCAKLRGEVESCVHNITLHMCASVAHGSMYTNARLGEGELISFCGLTCTCMHTWHV